MAIAPVSWRRMFKGSFMKLKDRKELIEWLGQGKAAVIKDRIRLWCGSWVRVLVRFWLMIILLNMSFIMIIRHSIFLTLRTTVSR
jgi:hypothetical protein